ncbi:MAG: hypothetical protein AAF664_04635 [Planctomycetota bacterium]
MEKAMGLFDHCSDEFYFNTALATEMPLNTERVGVMHFFEQIRRRFPEIQHFYRREGAEHVLEQERRGQEMARNVGLETKRLTTSIVSGESLDDLLLLPGFVYDRAPYDLAASLIDVESLAVTFGFDLMYRGNHNDLLAEVIGMPAGMQNFLGEPSSPGSSAGTIRGITYEPSLQFAVDEDCRTQARISFETRTGAFHVRTEEYAEEPISVYLTIRRYGSLATDQSFVGEVERLAHLGFEWCRDRLVGSVLQPLKETIAIR